MDLPVMGGMRKTGEEKGGGEHTRRYLITSLGLSDT